jgi:ornithine--oxo-acid transaminase
VSAVLSNKEVMDVLKPGEHGSTFGGNPLACAVARAALRVLVEEGMIENAAKMGEYLIASLRAINSPIVKEIRGRGLMVAVELLPDAGGARKYCEALKDRGILCKETHSHILRIMPPLIVTQAQIDEALVEFRAVLAGE